MYIDKYFPNAEDSAHRPKDTLHNLVWLLILDIWNMKDDLEEDICKLQHKLEASK